MKPGHSASITEGMSCADDIKNSMEHAAWLSAERTVEMAQEILRKPDSVLQYSCFNNYEIPGDLTAGLSSYISDNFGSGSANGALCVRMASIWENMKCQDFDKDWFRSFDEMASSDPRQFYKPCSASGRAAAWTNALSAAYPAAGSTGGMDRLETYNNRLYVSEGSCDDSLLIPTGLTMEGGEPDYVCTKPGCYVNGNQCSP